MTDQYEDAFMRELKGQEIDEQIIEKYLTSLISDYRPPEIPTGDPNFDEATNVKEMAKALAMRLREG